MPRRVTRSPRSTISESDASATQKKCTFEVVGLGQCSFDYLGIVHRHPRVDTKIEAQEWKTQGGGPVATALVTLSRFGVKTALIGKVGDDDIGKAIKVGLIAEAVNIDALRTDKGKTSQVAFIAVEKDTGRRTIYWTRGTSRAITADSLPIALIEQCKVLHVDGLMSDAAIEAARVARRSGVIVVFDAGHLRPGSFQLAKMSQHVVASEEFAKEYGGRRNPLRLAEEIVAIGPESVTITLGERGSVTADRKGSFATPAFRVPVVDTTGAGDVFHGAYIYGLLRGWALRDSVIFATAAAGIKCRALGGRSGLPGLDEVYGLIQTKDPDR